MEGEENTGLDNRQAPGTETELAAADQQRTQFGDDRPQFRSASPTDRSGTTHGERRTGRPTSPPLHHGEEVPTKRFSTLYDTGRSTDLGVLPPQRSALIGQNSGTA